MNPVLNLSVQWADLEQGLIIAVRGTLDSNFYFIKRLKLTCKHYPFTQFLKQDPLAVCILPKAFARIPSSLPCQEARQIAGGARQGRFPSYREDESVKVWLHSGLLICSFLTSLQKGHSTVFSKKDPYSIRGQVPS